VSSWYPVVVASFGLSVGLGRSERGNERVSGQTQNTYPDSCRPVTSFPVYVSNKVCRDVKDICTLEFTSPSCSAVHDAARKQQSSNKPTLS
jgi:hypothetical protein